MRLSFIAAAPFTPLPHKLSQRTFDPLNEPVGDGERGEGRFGPTVDEVCPRRHPQSEVADDPAGAVAFRAIRYFRRISLYFDRSCRSRPVQSEFAFSAALSALLPNLPSEPLAAVLTKEEEEPGFQFGAGPRHRLLVLNQSVRMN